MMRHLRHLLPFVLFGASMAPAACSQRGGPDLPAGSGGAGGALEGTGGSAAISVVVAKARVAGCDGAPDQKCMPPKEGCACSDCTGTALCNADQCVDDGVCDLRDACICADCHADDFCTDPQNCTDDGVCDSFYEGCRCADCAAKPECAR